MSLEFRDLLKKIASGPHTSRSLTRQEAQAAMALMLNQTATPAQIGAFLIAHRIMRPTGTELAGMLDAYDDLGPNIPALAVEKPVTILSQPYDGRDRTIPLTPLTTLVLAAAGYPVLQHGGDRMPTKYGVPLIDLWHGLGVDWRGLTLAQVHDRLTQTQGGFVYLPEQFPQAQGLVPYREEIGKRPPIATLELIWSPYGGPRHIVAGFVHPPTEGMIRDALFLRGEHQFTTIKGLEGSCDLPRDHPAIIGLYSLDGGEIQFTRLCLHARDYGLGGKDPAWTTLPAAIALMQDTLAGKETALLPSLLWNSGFHLWQLGQLTDITAGIELAQSLVQSQQVTQKLSQLQGDAKDAKGK
ncbi:MAG: anthranilate phosphoribosyltransferase family protein [Synechocystis sp.]|nr:anthranilate phosphoribosyltransferase family protein [Synechocystis sp.]